MKLGSAITIGANNLWIFIHPISIDFKPLALVELFHSFLGSRETFKLQHKILSLMIFFLEIEFIVEDIFFYPGSSFEQFSQERGFCEDFFPS